MLSAVAFILMFIEFPLPMLIPSFVKMDFSDLPALLGAFALGPVRNITWISANPARSTRSPTTWPSPTPPTRTPRAAS